MKPRIVRITIIGVTILGLAVGCALALVEIFQPDSPYASVLGAVAAATTVVLGADELFDRFRPAPRKEIIARGERGYLTDRIERFSAIVEDVGYVDLAGEEYEIPRFEEIEPGQAASPTRKPYQSISAAAANHQQLVIVGDPGAGKTTTLQELALRAMRSRSSGQTDPSLALIFGEHTVPLPLWVDLGRSDNPADVEKLLEFWWYDIWKMEGSAIAGLQQGMIWLFLDGLNEMPERDVSRKARAEKLREFIARFPDIHVIVTCRVADYQEDLNLGLPVVRVHALDETRWMAIARANLGAKAGDFISVVNQPENDHLRSMARNPYTLSKLLVLFKHGRLPEDMTGLYAKFLLIRYEEACKRSGLSFHLKWEKLMKKIQLFAFHLIQRGYGTAVSERRARWMTGHRVLQDSLTLGAVVRDPLTREISFDHQTLHQYFALPGLTKRLSSGRKGRRIRFMQQVGDLGEGGTPAIPALIKAAQSTEPTVMAAALVALKRINRDEFRTTWQQLDYAFPILPPKQKARWGQDIADADNRPGVGLDEDGLPDIVWLPVRGTEAFEMRDVNDNIIGTFPVPDFEVAKYPITYSQFQSFIDAPDGWPNAQWWEGLGTQK